MMRKVILALLFVAQANAYWHTANLCLHVVHAERAVVRTVGKVGHKIKGVFVRAK
jgi:hypothetical protein